MIDWEHKSSLKGTRLAWRSSIMGKITVFLLLAVALAYVSGAATGWFMIESSQREDWKRQASTNAQIASSSIRSIYSFVSVDLTPAGQIVRIVSERMIGDDQSVLDTGFVPVDVLALASMQTKERLWLLAWDDQNHRMVSMTDSDGGSANVPVLLDDLRSATSQSDFNSFKTGFARIGKEKYYISLLPISTPDGQLLGAVAASAGEAGRLLEIRDTFYKNSLLSFAIIMSATGAAIIFLMHRLFHPVPRLIEALKRIARDETGIPTPFLRRRDEIGQLANAVETLREAVVEREHLRQMREAARELEHLAHHDALTNLPNRAFLQKTLSGMLEKQIDSKTTINVMLLDLDKFKPVNDTYGHAVGDQVLIHACKRVSMLLGPDDIFARLGGDEFALIQIVALNARKEAERLASRIIEAIARPFQINDLSLRIGASIGIASAPQHGTTSNKILSNADVALYMSKGAGRGCFHIFEPGMTMEASHRSTAELELMQAIGQGEFLLHYQPIIRTQDQAVSGYEALVRWKHPKRGIVPPDQFIPLAEETGMIVDLDRWVLKQACTDMAERDANLSISVNVSALGLLRTDLPDFIRATLFESGLLAHRLELEITETSRVAEQTCLSVLTQIREMGVGIAIDDFGTGFASLSYLVDLPVTRIKLDRRFVSGVVDSQKCLNIISSTVSLARCLDIEVTAEGIENHEQFELLKAAGCKTFQGYLFGRPQLLETRDTRMQILA